MTKKLILILLVLMVALGQQNQVLANDASQSALPSSAIQSKLDQLKQEIASKAAEIKQAVKQKISNKAWGGVVKDKSDKSMTITSIGGDRKVMIDEYVQYVAKPKAAATLKDITVGDFIYALGDMDDAGNLVAKKVIKTKALTIVQPTQAWGEIKSVDGNIFKVASKSGELIVTTGAKTDFQLGPLDASIADAKVDHQVVTVGSVTGHQQQAYFVYFIPQTANEQPEKVASPSATASASVKPSAKPSASVTK